MGTKWPDFRRQKANENTGGQYDKIFNNLHITGRLLRKPEIVLFSFWLLFPFLPSFVFPEKELFVLFLLCISSLAGWFRKPVCLCQHEFSSAEFMLDDVQSFKLSYYPATWWTPCLMNKCSPAKDLCVKRILIFLLLTHFSWLFSDLEN